MITVDIAEAALILDTPEANVRKLVFRRLLKPIDRGTRPLRFAEDDVLELRYRRRPKHDRELIRRAADELLASV